MIDVVHTTVNRGLKEDVQDKLIYQWLMRLCKKIIFVCNNQRLHWEGKYAFIKRKSEVIYNGVDETFFSPEEWNEKGRFLKDDFNIPDDAFVLACIAGFRKEKGHHYLIDAVAKSEDNVYLLLAGDGELRESMRLYVRNKGLEDRVVFLGMVDEVRPVLAAADATVLASTAVETFSIAMLESMSMATPMIASDIGGMSEAIEDEVTGWLVSPGDVDQLTSVITSLAKNPDKSTDAGKRARKKVVALFSLESMARQMESIFDELLDK